jgi:hypothetical protein
MAKTEEWPGFGKRVRRRIRELGYVRPDGSEDIPRFTVKKGYVAPHFYKYLSNTTPTRANLLRLAADLEVSPAWLLFGGDASGGVIHANPQPVDPPSTLKEKRTTRRVSTRKEATLRKVPKKMAARSLRYRGQTAARGNPGRAA